MQNLTKFGLMDLIESLQVGLIAYIYCTIIASDREPSALFTYSECDLLADRRAGRPTSIIRRELAALLNASVVRQQQPPVTYPPHAGRAERGAASKRAAVCFRGELVAEEAAPSAVNSVNDECSNRRAAARSPVDIQRGA